ncbi:MAG TPA: urate hydroxylase PuuD [Gaiellaceae bacterium]|nr:urate hydroxylase PuuD [Gaiellaceae bacterium]
MDPYLRDVLDVLLRMLHVVAGIAWIGASFYFVRLDLALRAPKRREDAEAGVAGEFWGVHGGGLYHSQKYRLAPAEMPEPLHWFKWEAYTTWLSGFALMVVLYYFDADVRLVDAGAADLDEWQAVALSVGGIAVAWVVYDVLCRTVRSQVALAVVGTGLVALAAWGASEVFASRAAYLQVGVMLGTIMAANVFFVIIPAHRKLVAAMEEKREPDAAPLLEAKNRSVHNNYLTLPVLFTMLAGHFAFVFGADEAWLVFVVIAVLTALIRVFFNRWHAGRREWWIPAVAALGAVALAFWLRPEDAGSDVSAPVAFEQVQPVIAERCASCHSGVSAPLGVRLETREQIGARIDDIERQAVLTEAMPPGNATGMTQAERDLLGAWIAQSR